MSDSLRDLLFRVKRRQSLASALVWSARALWAGTVVHGALLLSSKLFSLPPEMDRSLWPLAVLALAAVAALILHRRSGLSEASQAIDHALGSRDLFLTSAHLENSTGAYQELVQDRARRRVADADVRRIAPVPVARLVGPPLAALALLALGGVLVPSFDLFGKGEEQQQEQQREEQRIAATESTQKRIAELARLSLEEPNSPAVDEALRALEQSFRELKAQTPEENRQNLRQRQNELGELWKLRNERRPAQSERRSQSMGQSQKMAQMQKDLSRGDTSSAKRELKEIAELAKKLREAKDPHEREALRNQLDRSMRELERAVGKSLPGSDLSKALSQALSQLRDSGNELADALDELDAALELSEMSLEDLAQALRDLDALEKALEAAQLANSLNAKDPLDGQACSCSSMAEYAELFAEMMAQSGGTHVCSECQGKGQQSGVP